MTGPWSYARTPCEERTSRLAYMLRARLDSPASVYVYLTTGRPAMPAYQIGTWSHCLIATDCSSLSSREYGIGCAPTNLLTPRQDQRRRLSAIWRRPSGAAT